MAHVDFAAIRTGSVYTREQLAKLSGATQGSMGLREESLRQSQTTRSPCSSLKASQQIIALEWSDIDLPKRQFCVQRSDWRGVNAPKGGRLRYVPLTIRLTAALREHRHLKGQRVLLQPDGSPLKVDMVGDHVRRAAQKAGVPVSGVHRLRHTFRSHLAMRGAAARAIQELAGHQDLRTTQRYMHLSPASLEEAIRLLEPAAPPNMRRR